MRPASAIVPLRPPGLALLCRDVDSNQRFKEPAGRSFGAEPKVGFAVGEFTTAVPPRGGRGVTDGATGMYPRCSRG
jgi:hypothetical protein